jgi:hypothetical protein
VTVVTVAGVSAGVAFAATTSPAGDGPGDQGGGQPGGSLAAAASQAALSKMASGYKVATDRAAGSRQRQGASSPAPASAKTARPGAARQRPAAKRTAAPAAAPAGPYEFYDAVDPESVPAGAEVATYADGPHPTPVSEVAGRRKVLWIDVDASDPQAQVLDVEPGCATPAQVPQWVTSRLSQVPGSVAIVYTMISEWSAVQAAVASLPAQERSRIRWWIADPTGSPHVVPGSSATQWYWGPAYDTSTALPGF